jgi:hypothetical protein
MGASVIADIVAYNEGSLSGQMLSANLTMDAVGLMGPMGAITGVASILTNRYYPGGVPGVMMDYGNVVEANRRIVPGWTPMLPGKI